jgi:hypothetical protein
MSEQQSSHGGAEPKPDPRTVELIHETVVRQIQAQSAFWDALDSKAYGLLTAGAAILGLASLAKGENSIFLILGAVAFAFLAVVAIYASWPRDFYGPASSRELFEKHRQRPPEELRLAIVETAALVSAPHNSEVLSRKARLVIAAMALISLEVAFIALWVLSGA